MSSIPIIVLVLLIFTGFAGVKMGRAMTVLFDNIRKEDPSLWRDLAKPSVGVIDLAGYIRANEILFKRNEVLAKSEYFGLGYAYARRWFYYFQGSGLAIIIICLTGMLVNAL